MGGACRQGLLCTLSLKKVIMVFAELFTIKSEVVVAGMEVDGYIKKNKGGKPRYLNQGLLSLGLMSFTENLNLIPASFLRSAFGQSFSSDQRASWNFH